jgi:kynurenine formamidase
LTAWRWACGWSSPASLTVAWRCRWQTETPEADEAALTGKAVLIRTGGTSAGARGRYWEPGPLVSTASLELLLRTRPKPVDVDFWNADDIDDLSGRVHTALLREQILIVEHFCNLASLPVGFVNSVVTDLQGKSIRPARRGQA